MYLSPIDFERSYKFKRLPHDCSCTIVMEKDNIPFVKVERSPSVTEWHYLNPTGEFNLWVMDQECFKVEFKGTGPSFEVDRGDD